MVGMEKGPTSDTGAGSERKKVPLGKTIRAGVFALGSLIGAHSEAGEVSRDAAPPTSKSITYQEVSTPRSATDEVAYQHVKKDIEGETSATILTEKLLGPGPANPALIPPEAAASAEPQFGTLEAVSTRVAADVGLDLLRDPNVEGKVVLCKRFLQKESLWNKGEAGDALAKEIFSYLATQKSAGAAKEIAFYFPDWRSFYAGKPWAQEIDTLMVKSVLKHGGTESALGMIAVASTLSPAEGLQIDLSPRLQSSVALLTYALLPLYTDLENDPALVGIEKIKHSLVLPLVTGKKVGPEFWENISTVLKAADERAIYEATKANTPVLPQTASIRFGILQDLSLQNGGVDPVELEQSVAYVARNLHMKGVEVSDSAVEKEVQIIQQERQRLDQESLFTNDMIVLSHSETLKEDRNVFKEGSPRFGTKTFIEALKTQHAKAGGLDTAFIHFNPLTKGKNGYSATVDSIEAAKEKTLTTIATSTRPLTVVFDGHGSEEAFFLSEGQVEDGRAKKSTEAVWIGVAELGEALAVRWGLEQQEHPNATELQISFVFSACMMQNFARALAENLRKRGVPLPHLMMSASEYGQYGFSDYAIAAGSTFNELVAKSPSLGNIVKNKNTLEDQTPTIFTPRPDAPGKLMQVSGVVVAAPADSAVA